MVTGCMEKELLDPAEDNSIRFGVSTVYENYGETRTEYTGKNEDNDVITNTSQYERINWLNSDMIRIVSAETKDVNEMSYTVTPNSDQSTANVTPVEDNAKFYWNGTDDHYFYALYPAPTQTGAPSGISINTASGHKATITASVPADQSQGITLNGRIYKPNMNYAYMYAAKVQKNSNPPETAKVTLDFKPLVTAFEFSLLANDDLPITANLTKAELLSSTTNLAGTFTANLDATTSSGISSVNNITGASKTLSITFPNGGMPLNTVTPTTFTFLALPREQTDLTLRLTFMDVATLKTMTRSLELKNGTTPIVVPANKKVYVRNVDVLPNVSYHFRVIPPEAHHTIDAVDGGSLGYKIISYAEYDNSGTTVIVPVEWTARFTPDGGDHWYTRSDDAELNQKGWSGMGNSGPGSYEGEEQTATASPNNTEQIKSWDLDKTPWKDNQADAIDLSYYNYKGESIARSTANCYVVSRTGWYKIPLVYGNAITNGAEIKTPYENNNSNQDAMKQFLRHDGQPIKGTWINGNTEGTHNSITVDGAILCWQDNNSIDKDGARAPTVKLNNNNTNYLYFYVNDNIKEGNSVIAAMSGNTIVWSWHIWIMEPNRLQTMQIGDYKMLNMNLGWVDAERTKPERILTIEVTQSATNDKKTIQIHQNANDVFGGNVFYQWGRKDPMLGADGNYSQMVQTGNRTYDRRYVDFAKTEQNAPDPAPTGNSWYYKTSIFGNTTGPYHKGRPDGWVIDAEALIERNNVKSTSYRMNQPIVEGIKNPNLFYYIEEEHTVKDGYKDTFEYQYVPQRWIAQQHTSTINSESKSFYDGRWYRGRYINLWDANAKFNTHSQNVVKTVYDPSPAGLKVPGLDVFKPIVGDEENNIAALPHTDLGWGFAVQTSDGKRMTFPRSALRNMNGLLRDEGYSGENEIFIWDGGLYPYIDETAYTESGGYLQWSTKEGARYDVRKGPQAYGMAVRPIEE